MIKGIIKTFLTFPVQQMIEIALLIKLTPPYSALLNELDIDANLNQKQHIHDIAIKLSKAKGTSAKNFYHAQQILVVKWMGVAKVNL